MTAGILSSRFQTKETVVRINVSADKESAGKHNRCPFNAATLVRLSCLLVPYFVIQTLITLSYAINLVMILTPIQEPGVKEIADYFVAKVRPLLDVTFEANVPAGDPEQSVWSAVLSISPLILVIIPSIIISFKQESPGISLVWSWYKCLPVWTCGTILAAFLADSKPGSVSLKYPAFLCFWLWEFMWSIPCVISLWHEHEVLAKVDVPQNEIIPFFPSFAIVMLIQTSLRYVLEMNPYKDRVAKSFNDVFSKWELFSLIVILLVCMFHRKILQKSKRWLEDIEFQKQEKIRIRIENDRLWSEAEKRWRKKEDERIRKIFREEMKKLRPRFRSSLHLKST